MLGGSEGLTNHSEGQSENFLTGLWFIFDTCAMIKIRNAGIPECRRKGYSGIVSFTVSPHHQSGIGIPASMSVRYRWSRIIPVVPSYD
jgi:hypothetical protein